MTDFLTVTVALLCIANATAAGLMYQTVKAVPTNNTAKLMLGLNTLAAIGCAITLSVIYK